jgi:allantoate deiminase
LDVDTLKNQNDPIGVDKQTLLDRVSGERIKDRIERIAEHTATPGEGCSRFTYSEEDRCVRDMILDWFDTLGLQVNVDAVGNIRARLVGKNPDLAPVVTGSHIDTVPHGGKFDGVTGVVSAIEAVTCIVDSGFRPERSIEIIVFAEEEGSNFGMTTAGSKTLVGTFSEQDLHHLKNEDGVSMFEMAERFGLHPEHCEQDRIRPGDVDAMIELHVEQSIVLDREGPSIGIVQAIAGGKFYRVHFIGEANHAGATPMDMRKDAMVAAANAIARFHELVMEKKLKDTVGTVGQIHCEPNGSNVIAERVTFTLDIRDVVQEGIDRITDDLEAMFNEVAETFNVTCEIEPVGTSKPVRLSERIIGVIEHAAQSAGLDYRLMNSGAVHDAAEMTPVTDVGMIFVPSIDGKSHKPDEHTHISDIQLGCKLLLSALLDLTAR